MSSPLARRLARRQPPPICPSQAVRSGVDSGVHRLLNTPMVINGVDPGALTVIGSQGAAGGWPLYETPANGFELQAGTALGYAAASPLLGSLEGGVQFAGAGGGWFRYTDALLGDVALEDQTVEALYKTGGGSGHIWGKRNNGGVGWSLQESSGNILFLLYDLTHLLVLTASPAVTAGQIVHILACINRNENSTNGARLYVSAVDAANGNPSAVTSTTNAARLAIGASPDGGLICNGTLFFGSLRKRTDWHQAGAAGPTEWLALAKARTALVFGARPVISWGGATGPTACGSTTPAHARKVTAGVTRLHYLGAGAPRFERVLDADGREFVGAHVDPGESNYATNCTALAGTEFSNNTLTAAAAVAPDGNTSMTRLVEKTSAASPHGRYIGSLASALNDVFSVSCHVRDAADRLAGVGLCCANHGVVSMAIVNPATGEVGSYVNSHHALVGSVGVERLDSGLYRLNARLKDNFGCGSQMLWYGLAESLSSGSFAGDATGHPNGALFWGAQFSKANITWPTSLIVTAGSSATRVADSPVRYSLTNILSGAQGAVRFRFLSPAAPAVSVVLLSLDDGSANNRLEIGLGTTGALSALSRKAAGTDGDCAPATNRSDNRIHEVMLAWIDGALDLWVDGVLTRDTSVTPPAGATLTALNIGADNAAANQCGPTLVGDVKISPRYQSSWTRRWSGFRVLS